MPGMSYSMPAAGGASPSPMAGSAFAGLSLISSLFGAYAAHQTGKAQKELMERNAQIATYQADDALLRGNVAASRRIVQTKQTIGAQRVALAAQGVDVNSGSAADIQENSAAIGAIDAQTIKNNAAREAWGYKMNAADYNLRGQLVARTADNEAAQTLLAGSSNLLLAQSGFGQSLFTPYPLFTRS